MNEQTARAIEAARRLQGEVNAIAAGAPNPVAESPETTPQPDDLAAYWYEKGWRAARATVPARPDQHDEGRCDPETCARCHAEPCKACIALGDLCGKHQREPNEAARPVPAADDREWEGDVRTLAWFAMGAAKGKPRDAARRVLGWLRPGQDGAVPAADVDDSESSIREVLRDIADDRWGNADEIVAMYDDAREIVAAHPVPDAEPNPTHPSFCSCGEAWPCSDARALAVPAAETCYCHDHPKGHPMTDHAEWARSVPAGEHLDPEHPDGAFCANTTGLDRCHHPAVPAADEDRERLAALWAEPHHLGFPVSGRTGTYDSQAVMVKRDWYERLAAVVRAGVSPSTGDAIERLTTYDTAYGAPNGEVRISPVPRGRYVKRDDVIAALAPDTESISVEHAQEAHYAQAINCKDEACPLNWARLTKEGK